MDGVYLLHLDPPLKHAKHYLGYSKNIAERFVTHVSGRGSPLVRAALAAGSEVSLVRVWDHAPQTLERTLKKRKNVPLLCPKCREEVLARRRAHGH